jgi:Superfamily I DNA and RNA helicases
MIVDPQQISDALGLPFSDEQLAAITAPLEPGVIIAGAGSGKTTVMAARVVWLVGSGQVRPEQVLGLTFTRKAAGELGARVRRALADAGLLEDTEAGEELILTYDAFASRLVAEHGLLLGIESDARLITGAARYRLAARVVNNAQGPLEKLSRLRPELVVERLLQLSGELRSHLVEPDRLVEHAATVSAHVMAAPRNPRGEVYADLRLAEAASAERIELAGLVADYERLKRELGYVEFADQMATAAALAGRVPEVGASVRREFAVVLLDEYQDTSSAQATLLGSLFSGAAPSVGRGHPVTAVGDPCQAIYGWRGAAANNILDFAGQFPTADGRPATAYALTVNRRSGQEILDAANQLAAGVRSDPALAAHGLSLDLVAPAETAAARVEARSFPTWPDEVAAIADRIVELHDTGAVSAWSQIAVLGRRNAQVAAIYAALAERDVPAEIVGLGGLLDLPLVSAVIATLTLLDDPGANPAAIELLTSPRWAIGLPDLAQLGRRAQELVADTDERPSLLEAASNLGGGRFSQLARPRLAAFARELRSLRRHAADPVPELVTRVIGVLGSMVEAEVAVRGGSRPLMRFVQAVNDYAAIDAEAGLSGLLAYLAAEREYGTGLDQGLTSPQDSVQVLTVHKAKGLEWEVVFVPGLAADVFPTDRVSGNWLRNAAVLPYPLRGDAVSLPELRSLDAGELGGFADALSVQQRLSEDRLAYVAVTRARRLLVASTHTWAPMLVKPRAPSDYFTLIGEHAQLVDLAASEDDENPLLAVLDAQAWPMLGDPDRLRLLREAAGIEPTELSWLPSADLAERAAAWRSLGERLVAAERAERERERGQLPSYLSVTALGRLAKDPDAFAAQLSRPLPRLVTAAQRWGIGFHRWLESRFGDQLPLVDDADDAELVGAEFERQRAAFEAGPYGALLPLAVEHPFTLVLGRQLVRGRIDAVFALPDGRHQVADWKTGGARSSDPLQLACYRLAWAELNGLELDEVDAVFYGLADGAVVRPPKLADRGELEALVSRLAH